MPVDLFLGGPLGLWVLDQVSADEVGAVYTETPEIIERVAALQLGRWPSQVGLSVHYPRLLPPQVLSGYRAIYNIHPGLLPWGRGYYPVFWSMWADEPTGCTLHQIDGGIDTGPIVAQRRVPKYSWDTGGSLHRRVSEAGKGLFLEYWPLLQGEALLGTVAQQSQGSYHNRADFFALKRDTVARSGTELLRLIRCLSHEQYTGLEVEWGGRQYEISARPM